MHLFSMLAQHSLITIYKAIVRSHLDYGDILYDQPNNESLCQEIESIVKEGNYYANCKKFVLPFLVYAGIKSRMSFAIKDGV